MITTFGFVVAGIIVTDCATLRCRKKAAVLGETMATPVRIDNERDSRTERRSSTTTLYPLNAQ